MFDPWKYLADHHPTVAVVWTALPGRLRGCTDGVTIWMDRCLTQAQKRVVVCHETVHVERGVPSNPTEERHVDRLTARRLIAMSDLIDALRVHRGDPHAAADRLWVEPATLQTRIDNLDPLETAQIEHALGVPFHDIGDTATRRRTGPAVRWGASVVPRR